MFTPIPGFPKYAINENGDVQSSVRKKPTILTPTNHNGGLGVNCRKENGVRVFIAIHKLMQLAFGSPSKRHVVHRNGNKTDNRLENLDFGEATKKRDREVCSYTTSARDHLDKLHENRDKQRPVFSHSDFESTASLLSFLEQRQ